MGGGVLERTAKPPDRGVFAVVKEALASMLLSCWRENTENEVGVQEEIGEALARPD